MTEAAAGDPPMEAEVRIYRGRSGLTELGDLWDGLMDSMSDRTPFHTYDWHLSYLETQEPEPEAAVFAACSIGGSLQAVLPLRPVQTMGSFGRHGLEVPKNPHVPFTDILINGAGSHDVVPILLRALAAEPGIRWDYLRVRRTLADSCAALWLRDIPGFHTRASESGGFHYYPVRSYDGLVGALTSHHRGNLRRAQKRADALGNVTYHTAKGKKECEALFPEFLEVEASGWKGKQGTATAIALDDRLRSFYEALTRRFAARGQCRIDVLRHEGRPIAAAFALQMDRTLYSLKIAFDESYAQLSPGHLLYWYIIRQACEDPKLETCNLVSDSTWKLQWRPHVATAHDIVVFRPGLGGRIANAEQRAMAQVADWGHRAARRWFVTGRGRRRLAWQRLRRH